MILLTYGTRPEYIKIKPIISEFKKHGIPYKVLFTGQHKDIANGDYDYKLEMTDLSSNRLDSVIGNLMNLPDEIFDGITYVLVQGDTTSVVGLALSALHRKIKVIHLEAGLRTYDTENPYPEENNRRIVSTIASIHLCPTVQNAENLYKERVLGQIHVVGNTVLDNLIDYKEKCEYTDKVLITMHRRENHDKINFWFTEINELAKRYPELEFILPIHPNPNVQKYKDILTHVTVIPSMNHDDLLALLVKTKLVITDSGGIQEECSFFNKKCIVCRKVTERPESLGSTSFLVLHPDELSIVFNEHYENYVVDVKSPYGDGTSAKKICKIVNQMINELA
jgi:UDP-N-acetylglucosamine 2-epimerase (non-hydrolysing)